MTWYNCQCGIIEYDIIFLIYSFVLTWRFLDLGDGCGVSKLRWRAYDSMEIKDLMWFEDVIFETCCHGMSNGIIGLC